jgi:xylulokinase
VLPGEIACITFSGQMMGCVPLDKNARPLRTAIIWADQRAVEQEHWVGERITPQEIYRISGHRLSASYSLQKILWLRDHQPDIFQRTHKFSRQGCHEA